MHVALWATDSDIQFNTSALYRSDTFLMLYHSTVNISRVLFAKLFAQTDALLFDIEHCDVNMVEVEFAQLYELAGESACMFVNSNVNLARVVVHDVNCSHQNVTLQPFLHFTTSIVAINDISMLDMVGCQGISFDEGANITLHDGSFTRVNGTVMTSFSSRLASITATNVRITNCIHDMILMFYLEASAVFVDSVMVNNTCWPCDWPIFLFVDTVSTVMFYHSLISNNNYQLGNASSTGGPEFTIGTGSNASFFNNSLVTAEPGVFTAECCSTCTLYVDGSSKVQGKLQGC